MGQTLRRRSVTNSLLAEVGPTDGTGDHDYTNRTSRSKTSHRCILVALVAVATVVILFVAEHLVTYNTEPSAGDQLVNFIFDGKLKQDATPPVILTHAIMMDAGSTGSRVLVFTFQTSPIDGKLVLLDEFFKEVKPGISSYANDPEKAAQSIQGLVNDAKKIVPAELWPQTTVSLKATAGLRLLPSEIAENLLNEIRDVFASSGFLVGSNAVSIIDGSSEGFYLWNTINFLLGKISGDLNESYVVTDMGGASAQVALVPLDDETVRNALPGDVSTVSISGRSTKFYIHSYLGAGLMVMRLSILRATNQTNDDESTLFLCPYVSQEANFTWEFQGIKYSIRGSKKAGSHAGPTHQLVEEIKRVEIRAVDELKRRTLFAVSYFYDVAVDAGLIEFSQGGIVSVGDFCRSAIKACTSASTELPFACIDGTYICTLLRDGYALPEDKPINLKKKIDGHETSWALGAAIVDLHNKETPF